MISRAGMGGGAALGRGHQHRQIERGAGPRQGQDRLAIELASVRGQQPAGGQPAAHDDMDALRHDVVNAFDLGVEPIRHQHLARPGREPRQALRLVAAGELERIEAPGGEIERGMQPEQGLPTTAGHADPGPVDQP